MSDDVTTTTSLGQQLASFGMLTWAWVIGLSLWGGIANFFRKLRQGAARPFNVTEFCGEIFISGFVGMCTFMLCMANGLDPLLTSPLVAISGHMGSRGIFLLEQVFVVKLAPAAAAAVKEGQSDA